MKRNTNKDANPKIKDTNNYKKFILTAALVLVVTGAIYMAATSKNSENNIAIDAPISKEKGQDTNTISKDLDLIAVAQEEPTQIEGAKLFNSPSKMFRVKLEAGTL